MHPALIVLVIVGGAAAVCAGYEHRQKVFDWWNEWWETREYEQYVRAMTEKQASGAQEHQREKKFDDEYDDSDDDDDDDLPLLDFIRKHLPGSDKNVLRRRGEARTNTCSEINASCSDINTDMQDSALLEMERTVQERKAVLRREAQRLFEAERDLERRKFSLQSRGNSIMGIMSHDYDLPHGNPFADDPTHVVPTYRDWAERASEVHGPSDSEESWDRMERSSHGSQSSSQSWIKATK